MTARDPRPHETPPQGIRRLARRLGHLVLVGLARAALGLVLLVVFVVAALGGLGLHANLPVSRRIVAQVLTTSLTSYFEGSLTVGRIEHLDLHRLQVSEVVVHDPRGELVLRVEGLRARADLVKGLRQLLLGEGKQSLVIDHVRAERVECMVLQVAGASRPTIADAFMPAGRTGPRPPGTTARELRVWFAKVEIGEGYARGVFPELGTFELELAKAQGTVLATNKGAAVDVERFGVVIRGLGGADARGTGDVHVRAPGAFWTSFDGFVGDLGVAASAYFKKGRMELRLDLPRATPEAARSVWKAWPLHDVARLHAEAAGELPLLDTQATVQAGPATVRAQGKLRLAGDVGARIDIDAQHLDLRSLVPSAPPTDISGKTRLVMYRDAEELAIAVNGYSLPATVADVAVPATDVTGDFLNGGFAGTATLHEKGIPLKVTLNVKRDGTVDLDVDMRTFRLQGAPRVAGVTRADGVAELRVKGTLIERQLEASVTGKVRGFVLDPVRVDHLDVTGAAAGSVDDPLGFTIDGHLAARGVRAGGFAFRSVDITARGPFEAPRVVARLLDDVGPSVELSGQIEHQVPRARGVELAVTRGGARVEGRVALVDLAGDEIRVSDLHLRGLGGKLDGDAIVRPGLLQVDAQGERIDLDAAGRLVGLEPGMLAGRLGFDAEVSSGHDVSQGRVALRLDDGACLGIQGIAADFTASLDERHLTGAGDFAVASFAELHADWDTHLGAHPLTLDAWRDLVGRVSLRFDNIELVQLGWLLPEHLGIVNVNGTASATVQLDRRFSAALPSVTGSVVTTGLEVTRQRAPERPEEPPVTLTYDHIDAQLGLSLNGESGFTLVHGALYHDLDPFVLAEARLGLDLQRLVRDPEAYLDIVGSAPASIDVELRDRELAAWPTWLRTEAVVGTVGGQAYLTGTLKDPLVRFTAHGRGLRVAGTEYGKPLDMQAALNYRVIEGAFSASADVRTSGRRIAHLQLDGQSPRAAVLDAEGDGKPGWRGDAQLRFYDFPLEVIPWLGELEVGGTLAGALNLERRAKHPTIRATLDLTNTSIARTRLGNGKLRVATTQDAVDAEVKLTKGDGWMRAKGKAGLTWARGVPGVDPAREVRAALEARQFEAAVLAPLVDELFTELGGKIDADVEASFTAEPALPAAAAADADGTARRVWRPRATGTATLSEGVVQVGALGLELRNVSSELRVSSVGRETKLELVELSAEGKTPDARLSGRGDFYLDGGGLSRGVATLTATDLPIPVGGVALAKATTAPDERDKNRGQHQPVTVRLERRPEEMLAEVEIPALMARLPPSVTRSVIDTADNPSIRVAQPLRKPEGVRKNGSVPWHVVFDVGPRARVFYDEFEVKVSGRPELVVGARTTVDGYVDLDPGGHLPVLGKEFRVESGRIMLDPEQPTNPNLDVTASWESPYATIYLRVRGRWNDPDLQLESDGGHSPDQIWIILAGGSPDDPTGSQEGGSVQAAYQAARSLGVMRLFETERFGFSPDTSAGNTKARVSYRVSDRVRVEAIGGSETEGATATEADAAGNTTEEQRRFVGAGAVEYRIDKHWSVRTEAGNASAEVDLMWQYRY